jgi:hypothetical protein
LDVDGEPARTVGRRRFSCKLVPAIPKRGVVIQRCMRGIPEATPVMLTEVERTELEALARSTKTEYRLRQRARIILLYLRQRTGSMSEKVWPSSQAREVMGKYLF